MQGKGYLIYKLDQETVKSFRDHPLFSAFSQECRKYAREEGVKFTCTLFKNVDLKEFHTEKLFSVR